MASKKKDFDVEYIAKLANIKLTKSEKKLFALQLKEILSYVSKLSSIQTKSVESVGHIANLKNITREDEAAPSLSQKDALSNASKKHNGFFQISSIFKDD